MDTARGMGDPEVMRDPWQGGGGHWRVQNP